MSSQILTIVEELINKAKAKGYTSEGKYSGGPAEAVSHEVEGAPSEKEDEHKKNKANSGTFARSAGKAGSDDRAEGGEDFKDGSEDTIGPEGKAASARPGTIKHEATNQGPDHPGTATKKEKSVSADLNKSDGEEDNDDDAEEKEEEVEDSEKSSDSEEFLDIDEFANEIRRSVYDDVMKSVVEIYGDPIEKSEQAEYISAGLAKSISAAIDRIDEIEKAIDNISKTLSFRKSLIRSSDRGMIKSVKNSSLEGETTLTKSEIADRMLDLQIKGDPNVNTNMILKFDATGDISVIPDIVKSKIGLD
jgi:hypothetical protein